jgi:hypothetical protein
MAWNLKELREDVESLYGKTQRELLSPSIETIVDKKFAATYHYRESERLIKEELKGKESDAFEITKLLIGINKEEYENFNLARMKAGANIIACLQSLHSLADVIAHAIYFALNMNNDPETAMRARKVNASSVLGKLNRVVGTDQIKGGFDSLINHNEFRYLSDIVNQSKHRSFVGTSFKVNLDSNKERSHGLEFNKFEYGEREYEKKGG